MSFHSQLRGLWSGLSSSPKGYKFAPGRTRTGNASITHIPGPLFLLSYKGIGGPEAEVNPRAEGKRSGSAEIRPHTPIVTYATLVFPLARGIFNFFYETMKDL